MRLLNVHNSTYMDTYLDFICNTKSDTLLDKVTSCYPTVRKQAQCWLSVKQAAHGDCVDSVGCDALCPYSFLSL